MEEIYIKVICGLLIFFCIIFAISYYYFYGNSDKIIVYSENIEYELYIEDEMNKSVLLSGQTYRDNIGIDTSQNKNAIVLIGEYPKNLAYWSISTKEYDDIPKKEFLTEKDYKALPNRTYIDMYDTSNAKPSDLIVVILTTNIELYNNIVEYYTNMMEGTCVYYPLICTSEKFKEMHTLHTFFALKTKTDYIPKFRAEYAYTNASINRDASINNGMSSNLTSIPPTQLSLTYKGLNRYTWDIYCIKSLEDTGIKKFRRVECKLQACCNIFRFSTGSINLKSNQSLIIICVDQTTSDFCSFSNIIVSVGTEMLKVYTSGDITQKIKTEGVVTHVIPYDPLIKTNIVISEYIYSKYILSDIICMNVYIVDN